MERVYLRINTEVGKERQVRDALRKIKGVKLADIVTGRHDVIAVLEEETLRSIFRIVTEKIRSLEGVTKSETDLAVE